MFKRLAIGVFCCACTGIALGAASVTKIRAFAAVGDGQQENADGDGMAVVTFNPESGNPGTGDGQGEVTVVVTGMLPDTTYRVLVQSDFSGLDAAFATNPSGNGNFHTVVTGPSADLTQNTCVIIYIDEDNSTTLQAGEERLQGGACQ